MAVRGARRVAGSVARRGARAARLGVVVAAAIACSIYGSSAVADGSAPASATYARQVAITIDDVPRGDDGGPNTLAAERAMTAKLLRPLREQRIPVIGFVNAARHNEGPQALQEILGLWLAAGADLGNHTATHPDIDAMPLADFEADILAGEPPLRAALAAHGGSLRYFRHPFLHTGATAEDKAGLQRFLDAHGYIVAPVTIDDADYAFAALYQRSADRARVQREYLPYMESVVAFFERRSVEVFGREIPQVLLIHASQLNADYMPRLLEMFRRRGYAFVPLSQALADPAYATPESFVGKGGFSWMHRWSMAKGMPNSGEPEAPEWVTRGFAALR